MTPFRIIILLVTVCLVRGSNCTVGGGAFAVKIAVTVQPRQEEAKIATKETDAAEGLELEANNNPKKVSTKLDKATLAKVLAGLLSTPAGLVIGIAELVKYLNGQDTTTRPPTLPPADDLTDVEIPGVTDNPRRLVTVHSYTKGVSDAATAACALPVDEPGFGLIEDKNLGLGKSVSTQDCKIYTCLRVYETAQFDMALISEYEGCWYKNNCYMVGVEFRDDRCYRRVCEIVRSKVDNKVRSNIKFASTVADCPTADGSCVPPRTSGFECFHNGVFDSHCVCKKKGSVVFLDSLMRFGAKVPTIGGNANGTYCFFKFLANGQYNNKCIVDGRDKEWCATTSNYDRDGKWGYCTESPRYRYTKDDLKCHFPFKYNGMLYHDCTTDGSENGEAWCSTQFKYDPAKKGICDMSNK